MLVAAFKEEASLAYTDILSGENKAQKGVFKVTIDEVIDRLINKYDYDENRFVTVIDGDFELTSTDTNETLQVLIGTPIVKSAITSTDATTNYIEINGKYYEINVENGKITVGDGLTDKPENSGNSTLNVESSDSDIVGVTKTSESENNFRITITGKEETSQGSYETITISYGSKTSTINVEVKAVCTLDVSSENTDMGTVSVSPSAITGNSYIKGTEVTLSAEPKAGTEYVFKGWYNGETKVSDDNPYRFTLNSNTTLTAKFGEDVIDNSGSLVEGFVDDLGTRATIYLYGNPLQIKSGSITITMPDSTTKSITALSGNTSITSTNNYATYTVAQNGTYTFSATGGGKTTETKIRVRNIETFTSIETLASEEHLSYAGGDTKAYAYRGAAVPKGYYVDTNSGTDENPGLVITDSIIKVNTNDTTGYSNGNEWVWVPVNSTVGNHEFYDTDDTDTTGKMAGIDSGTKDLKYSKYSLLYDFTTNASTKETTRTAKAKTKPSATSGFREIAILTYTNAGEKANLGTYPIYSRATAKNTRPTALASEEAIASQYIADYKNMVTSVSTYNGFYIGRYEITENGEQPGTSLAGTISGTAWNWFALYNKCMTLNMENTETSMMYGTLWDATMQWLNKSGYIVGQGSTTSEYGNYNTEAVKVSNSTTTITVKANGTSVKLSTGQTSYTRSNNIYDLSGNCYDWTQEAYNSNYRVLRGGYYCNDDSSSTYSAYRRTYNPTGSGAYCSSRPQLYIK